MKLRRISRGGLTARCDEQSWHADFRCAGSFDATPVWRSSCGTAAHRDHCPPWPSRRLLDDLVDAQPESDIVDALTTIGGPLASQLAGS